MRYVGQRFSANISGIIASSRGWLNEIQALPDARAGRACISCYELTKSLCPAGGGGDSAACHHLGHLAAITFGAMDILDQVEALGGMAGSVSDGSLIQLLADEGSFHAAGPRWLRGRAGDDHAGRGANAGAIEGDNRSAARDGVVRSLVRQLHVGASSVRGGCGEAQLRQYLVGLQRRLERTLEEIVGLDRAPAVGTLRDEIGFEGENDAGHISGWVSVRDATADGAAIAYRRVADLRGAFGQDRVIAGQHLGGLDLPIRGHRADGNRAILFAKVGK